MTATMGIYRLGALAVAIAFCCVALVASSATADARSNTTVKIYVSPSGNDRAVGTRAKPLKTLTAARNRARRLLAKPGGDIRVLLLDGTFRVQRALRLDARDSGKGSRRVSYQAAKGANPSISGAIDIGKFTLVDSTLGIYRASVPVGTVSRQLYVNGRRAIRARGQTNPNGFVRTENGFKAPDASMAQWQRPGDLEIITTTQWKMMSCPVQSIAGDQIAMEQPCWTNVNVFPYLWSFQLVSRVENAYELLDQPGEWYLDSAAGSLFYKPRVDESIRTADVELPVAERLIDGVGTPTKPVRNISFSGITFEHATWMDPSSANGYATDQSGFHLVGGGHQPNLVGHDDNPVRTPGNISFRFARSIGFSHNTFARLGAVALDFDTGSQSNSVIGNRFDDISSAAVQVGGISAADHHPPSAAYRSIGNNVANNLIRRTGREFEDSAAIFAGYTTSTRIAYNDIANVPWSGIALGWGWGLVDPGSYLGLPGATPGMWGTYSTPTATQSNVIQNNRISKFLLKLWDGGGIYTVGQQGTSQSNGTTISGNVITSKRRLAGGNTIYTDGGSRYVNITNNILYDNPQGITDFGPCGLTDSLVLCWVILPYGTDRGGCRTYGDIDYTDNYWQNPTPFFDICPYPPHPVNIVDNDNTSIIGPSAVSRKLLRQAGLQPAYRNKVGAK